MENEFESALQGLLNFEYTDAESAEKYNQLFRSMIAASMKICGETDYSALVQQKIEAAEKKFGAKMEESDETDAYKKLREVIRFEMSREAAACSKEFEICCTDSNFNNAMAKIRGDLEKIVPESQKEVVDSIGYSLFSDFTKYFVCTTFDMIADAKIYTMKEFRPLQLNALGKELRTNVNVIRQQNAKAQKSETVTNWFRILMMLPAFLFKKLYAVNMVNMFENSEEQVATAAEMFEELDAAISQFSAGDEYKVLQNFLKNLQLENCFTVRIKPKNSQKPIVN
ncbi:MAG: hypothetical protein MJY99_06945 [Fibrobacter sp.]|nr:hypothetical protein [Fibrobacter sp.]